MSKYLISLFLFSIVLACVQSQKKFIIKNDFKNYKLEISKDNYFWYEINSEFLNKDYSSIEFKSLLPKKFGDCRINVYTKIEFYGSYERDQGIFLDLNISNDSLKTYIKKSADVVEIKSYKVSDLNYRIVNILSDNNEIKQSIATVKYKDFIIYFNNYGFDCKTEDFFQNSEKMIKSIEIKKL